MSKPKKKSNKKKSQAKNASASSRAWIANFSIVLALTLIAMLPVLSTGLLNYDDELYITENPFIQAFDIGNLFTEIYQNQYSPIAMTLMALQYKLGFSVGLLKFVSVLWHLLNTALVFFIVDNLFRPLKWAQPHIMATFAALLFGVSTMQLESVAWLAASMKIGSYAFFSLLSIYLYLKYLDQNDKKFLWISLGVFVLACLCKEQAVALAPTLVLIDYFKKRAWLSPKILIEKIPFFIVALAFGLLTLKASSAAEVKHLVYDFNLGERILFASYALGSYFTKLTMPFNLSFFYTYPVKGAVPAYYYIYAILFLAVLSLLFNAIRRDNRVVVFGILFFLINIGLTIFTQVLSVRDVIMADRYVYLSSIGWFVILGYLLFNVIGKHFGEATGRYIGGLMVIAMTIITFMRGPVWKDSLAIFTDVIEKEEYTDGRKNPYLALPYNNRGIAYKRKGDVQKAMTDFNSAIAASQKYASGFLNRGNIYFNRGDNKMAMKDYDQTLKLDSNNAKALSARGAIYAQSGQMDRALTDLNKAIELEPYFTDALSNRGLVYMDQGNYKASIADFTKILEFDPRADDIYSTRGVVYSKAGQIDQSIQDHSKAIQLNPNKGSYYINRAYAYSTKGNKTAALQDAQRAQQLGAKVSTDFLNSLR